jgi:hypothetical protein
MRASPDSESAVSHCDHSLRNGAPLHRAGAVGAGCGHLPAVTPGVPRDRNQGSLGGLAPGSLMGWRATPSRAPGVRSRNRNHIFQGQAPVVPASDCRHLHPAPPPARVPGTDLGQPPSPAATPDTRAALCRRLPPHTRCRQDETDLLPPPRGLGPKPLWPCLLLPVPIHSHVYCRLRLSRPRSSDPDALSMAGDPPWLQLQCCTSSTPGSARPTSARTACSSQGRPGRQQNLNL